MADYMPYMNAYGRLSKILDKIKTAATPERFTQDYLATKLGFPGGSPKPFISLAKRLKLLGTDGTPSELYKRFRNPKQSKAAMAEAIRNGYSALFERNEYANNLDKVGLKGLMVEITGLEEGNSTLKSICGTFEALKEYADFEARINGHEDEDRSRDDEGVNESADSDGMEDLRLNLSYTINLVLPKTDDIAVFNAIFKSLKANLLRKP